MGWTREVAGDLHLSMGMFTTNLDKALGIPLGFAITSFGLEGG